jgi:hypothetical protein
VDVDGPTAADPGADDPHQLRPDHLPTPFSAAEIRDATRPGKTLRVLLEEPGEAPVVRVTRFVETDAEGAFGESQFFTRDGEPLGEAQRTRSSWDDLQTHASFPAATTTLREESIDLEFGRFDALLYTVIDGPREERFWFARALPGMPVRTEELEDGVLRSSMTMIEHTPGSG